MDEFYDDEWIQDNYPAEIRRLHALGIIHVYWNQCENALFRLFIAITKLPDAEAWAIAHDLGDIALSNRIRALLEVKKFPDIAQDSISSILNAYDICRQNRNQLTHYTVFPFVDDFRILRKSKKPESLTPAQFPSALDDVRRVVDDIKTVATRLWLVIATAESWIAGGPAPWPPILPVPELLWKPPPPVRPEHPFRSSPSGA